MTFGELRQAMNDLGNAAFDKIDELAKADALRCNAHLAHAFFLVHDELRDLAELPAEYDAQASELYTKAALDAKRLMDDLAAVKTPRDMSEWAERIRNIRRII